MKNINKKAIFLLSTILMKTFTTEGTTAKLTYKEYNAKSGEYYTCFWNAIGAYYPGSDRNNAIKTCNKSMVDYFGTKDNESVIDTDSYKKALAHQKCSNRYNFGFKSYFELRQKTNWNDPCLIEKSKLFNREIKIVKL